MPILDLPSAHVSDADLTTLPMVATKLINGVRDSDLLSAAANAELVKRDFLYVLAVMCSPDASEVVRLNRAVTDWESEGIVRDLFEAGIDFSVDPEVALSFVDRENWKPIIEGLIRHDWLAHIASGYILRWVLPRWERSETRAEASLAKAFGVVEEWCKANRIAGGGRQNIKQHMWPKYRCVSHLWAAWYILQDTGRDVITLEGMSLFLTTAHALLQRGAAIVPKGRKPGDAVLSVA